MANGYSCGVCGAKLDLGTCYFCSRPKIAIRTRVETLYRDTSTMGGVEFEHFVRDLLLKQGYDDVQSTPVTGDMGADLIVYQGKTRIVVQCKRYGAPVGVAAIQEVLGAKHYYDAAEAWVITDSTFTPASKKLAQAVGVRLRQLKMSPKSKG